MNVNNTITNQLVHMSTDPIHSFTAAQEKVPAAEGCFSLDPHPEIINHFDAPASCSSQEINTRATHEAVKDPAGVE